MTRHLSEPQRKGQILEAAFEIFTSQGFETTTVEQIAIKAGLSKGAIYWYYPGKMDILIALVDRFVEENVAGLGALVRENQLGPEALYSVHRQLYTEQINHPLNNSLFGQFCNLAGQHPEIQERLIKYHRMWDEAARGLISDAIANGKFKPVDALLVSQAIGGMYEGLGMRAKLDPSLDVIAVIETATRLFYEALILKSETK